MERGNGKINMAFYKLIDHKSSILKEQLELESGIRLNIAADSISINIPLEALDTLFYRITDNILEISTDLRLLYTGENELDSTGISSLLILGALVPPLSPFKEIKSFLPGYKYEIDPKTFEMKSEPDCKWSEPTEKDYKMDINEQVSVISKRLDEEIRAACPTKNPIVLFSGGVDSTAIGMRVIELGWKEAAFVHYSFGADDNETRISKEIARQLSIPLDIITDDLDLGYQCLNEAAYIYPEPFVNHGVVQSYTLMNKVISKYSREQTILDGIGADGIYGLFGKIKQSRLMYKFPNFLRKEAGKFYSYFDLWMNESKLELLLRWIRRSAYLSHLPNFIALNPLINIGYTVSSVDLAKINEYCNNWIHDISRTNDELETIPLIDNLVYNFRRSVPKLYPLFRQNGCRVHYPYMTHESIDLALNHTRFWPGSRYPKRALKHLITQKIAHDFVYRQKQGFLGPLVEKFTHPVFLEHFDQILNSTSPFTKILNLDILLKMRDQIMTKKDLPIQTYTFIWAATFLNTWLNQLHNNLPQIKRSISIQ